MKRFAKSVGWGVVIVVTGGLLQMATKELAHVSGLLAFATPYALGLFVATVAPWPRHKQEGRS